MGREIILMISIIIAVFISLVFRAVIKKLNETTYGKIILLGVFLITLLLILILLPRCSGVLGLSSSIVHGIQVLCTILFAISILGSAISAISSSKKGY